MRRLTELAIVGVFILGACGGTDGAAPSGDEVRAFCEAKASLDAVSPDTPDEAALHAYQAKVRPLLEGMLPSAPATLSADVGAMSTAVLDAKTLEEAGAAMSDETAATAKAAVSTWVHDECGFQQATVVAVDNRYQRAPSSLDAGRVSLLLRNEGKAGHAMVVFKVNAGESGDAAGLAGRDPETWGTFANAVFAPPGTSTGVVMDMPAGRYVYFDDEHAADMRGELTVS